MASFTFNTTRQCIPGKRERKTIGASATGITESVYTVDATEKTEKRLASAAVIEVRGTNETIYWAIDGSTASSTVGFTAATGDVIYLDSQQKVLNFNAIRSDVTDVDIEVLPLWGA